MKERRIVEQASRKNPTLPEATVLKNLRELGCPEPVITRAIDRKRSRTGVPVRTANPVIHAPTATQLQRDAERLRKAEAQHKQIAADADAERRRKAAAQAKQISADAEQEQKDAELKRRMDVAAGRR